MKIDVSIIVPVYNCEKYINRCIESLINQTYKHIEIIIIDDGSNDKTKEKLKEYNNYENITIIYQTNNGVSSARNNGIKRAKGEYIIFVDGDDYVDKDMVSDLVDFAKNNNLDIVKYNYDSIFANKVVYRKPLFDKICIIDESGFKENIYLNFINNYSFSSCVLQMFKKDVIGTDLFNEHYSYGEDYLFCMQQYSKIKRIGYIPKAYYHYVTNDNSITRNININKKVILLNNCREVYSKLFDYIQKWDMNDYYDVVIKRILKETEICLSQIAINCKYSVFEEIFENNRKNIEKYKINKCGVFVGLMLTKNSRIYFWLVKIKYLLKNIIKRMYLKILRRKNEQ